MMQGMGGMMAACMGSMGAIGALLGGVGLAAAAGIVYAVRHGQPRPQLSTPHGTPDDSALKTLRDRFARGEIERTEYDERRRALLDDEARWP